MKPIPWFWIARLVVSCAACILWGLAYPGTPIWQIFIVAIVVIAAMEGLRWGYQHEQDQIRDKRKTAK